MLNSMTAYARASQTTDFGTLTWEIRSVNHRYFELSPRMPEDFRVLEPVFREGLKQRFARGKFDIGLRYQPDPAATAGALELNRPLAEAVLGQLESLVEVAGWRGQPDPVRLLAWPGMMIEPAPDLKVAREAAATAFNAACEELEASRRREGEKIESLLLARLDGIEAQVARVRESLPAVRESLKQRFEDRIASLGMDLEPGRLEQEVALQLTKLDVDEELDRLETHVAEVRRVIAADEPAGRRLDFLMQELNREANTLGAKAVTAETSGVSVELKVLIEQMREQVQNVE